MKKIMLGCLVLLMLCGCSAAKEKAACTLVSGNNTVTMTEGRDVASDKDGQIVSLKQTLQIDSAEPDVLVIYKEYYEKQLSEYASDEKMKTSIVDTETGILVTLEFDVKNISPSSKDAMMETMEIVSLDAEALLTQMKDAGFKCGDEENADSSADENTDENTGDKKDAE